MPARLNLKTDNLLDIKSTKGTSGIMLNPQLPDLNYNWRAHYCRENNVKCLFSTLSSPVQFKEVKI